jgi:Monogalactosyldiacylglycerol synthase (EC 2.4.1.46)
MGEGGAPDISVEASAPRRIDMPDVPHDAVASGGKPRILFAISDTGGGHRSGAQAIAAAIEQQVGEAVETYIIDIFAHTGVPVVRNAPVVYDKLSTRWLPIYDILYRLTDVAGVSMR